MSTLPDVTEFGETAPCDRIAEKHHVEPSIVLYIMDDLVHGRVPPIGTPPLQAGPAGLWNDCMRVAARTIAQHQVPR